MLRMNRLIICVTLLSSSMLCSGQTANQSAPQDIVPGRLQSILDLPLAQSVEQRQQYKSPLKAAYERQLALGDKDCQTESNQGQQPYNICIGKANEQADADFAVFYNNLQMLCHDQNQLATLQASQHSWQQYRDSAMKAATAAWPNGTGAPGFAGEVYLSLVRNRMKELYKIYGLNISQ
jgi:uncharacterized protein YecT (DUF1311 family)